jgi:O-antigen ligase
MLAHGLLALYLMVLLAVPRAPTTIAALACLAALAAAHGRWLAEARRAFRHMAVLVIPAGIYLLHLLLQIVFGMASPQLASQLLIGMLTIALGLSDVPSRMPDLRRWILPAAAIGATASAVVAIYQVLGLGYLRPYGWLGGSAIGNGAIKFGDLAALQALLSLVLVLTAAERLRRLLGLAGLFGGMLSLALTQTRGGLLGVLLAVAALWLALFLHRRRIERAARREHRAGLPEATLPAAHHGLRRGTSIGMLAVALVLSLSAAGFMQDRFAAIEPQVQRYLHGDVDSEVGQRLALWGAAVRAGRHQPLTGVGFGHFDDELERQVAAGEIPGSERIIYGHPHSEYLAAFAEAGVSGFLALLLMFVAPMVAMARQIAARGGSPAACAALVTSAAFAGFALTDDMFDRQITVIAFYLLNAWFLRAAFRPTPEDEPQRLAPEPGSSLPGPLDQGPPLDRRPLS